MQGLCTVLIANVCSNDAFKMEGTATSVMLVMLLLSSEKLLQLFLLSTSQDRASI